MAKALQVYAFTAHPIVFATGLECSYPTVEHGKRRDELAETGHYRHWREDFRLCKEIGAGFVRYGPPYYRIHSGPHRYDWSWTDEVLPVMRDTGLEPILDLCHFGVPDWVGGFQNPDWPQLFADFAAAFSRRYPWIKYYTPVNEILVCARHSAGMGLWNEQLKSDRAMITAHSNMCRATLLATRKILESVPDAVFFQSETAEFIFERWPETRQKRRFLNQLRFLTFDLLYGHPPDGEIVLFLLDNGMSREDLRWFLEHGERADPHCVLGMDYYAGNEKYLDQNGEPVSAGPVLGWYNIGRQYYARYRKPMMLTETNSLGSKEAVDWLWKTWQSVQSLREDGVPVLGFTWYSLTDQVDWDIGLKEIRGKVNPIGLYDLDRKPHPVAEQFRELTRRYGSEPILPQG